MIWLYVLAHVTMNFIINNDDGGWQSSQINPTFCNQQYIRRPCVACNGFDSVND